MSRNGEVRVWDPMVRLFHWTLVAAFAAAYLTGDEERMLSHAWAGYVIIGLLLVRVVWGFVGPASARFSSFVRRPAAVMEFVRDSLSGRAARYRGHNPAGGWMVVLLMVMLALVGLTGLMLYGAGDHGGPLAPLMAGAGAGLIAALEDWHGYFVDVTVFLVLIHLAGVAAETLLLRENLVMAMITGSKRERPRPPRLGGKGALIGGLLAVVVGGFALGILGGADRVQADTGEGEPVDAKDLQDLLPLEAILVKAKEQHNGELIEAELKKVNGVPLYEAEILDAAGKVWEMHFNARTGELVTQEEDQPGANTSR